MNYPKIFKYQPTPITQSENTVLVSETYGTVDVIGGDEQTLRAFIQRWFAPINQSSNQNSIITFDQIPENFPAQLPLPEGAQFVASVQTPYDWQILLDISIPSEDVLSSYSTILADAKWIPAPDNTQGGGFVSAPDNCLYFVMMILRQL